MQVFHLPQLRYGQSPASSQTTSEIAHSGPSESIAVEDTDFWKEMQSNRIGNLLYPGFFC